MVWKEIAVKKYVVRLSAEERAQLNELIRKGKRSAQLLTKARILLKADVSELGEGWSDSRIAVALDTSIANGSWPTSAARSSASASRDLPAPDGPRISTARAPTSTAEA